MQLFCSCDILTQRHLLPDDVCFKALTGVPCLIQSQMNDDLFPPLALKCNIFVAGKLMQLTGLLSHFLTSSLLLCYQTVIIVTFLNYVYFSGKVIHCATMATSPSLSSDCIDPYSGSHGYHLLSVSCDAYSATEAQSLQAYVSHRSVSSV